MEYEEQKPKDIILSDREIKQEMDEFLESIKEDSMEKEDLELIIPKQETEDPLVNVKEKPIDVEYFDQIVPKLEENMESSTSDLRNQEFHAKNPVQKVFAKTPNDFYKLDVDPQANTKINRRCSVCSLMKTSINVKHVTLVEDKLVTMIGCVLNGSYTLDQAQLFITSRRTTYICYVHFSEAINKICNVLNIENTDEITTCSSESMENLMITINTIYPQTEYAQFSDIVRNFFQRNISRKQNPSNTEEEQHKKHRYGCSLCRHAQTSNNVKNVTMKDERLVLMIRCILRGGYTLEQAHAFISREKRTYICHIHFSQSVDEIHKALIIKKPGEVYSCSTELMKNLMITVNKLDSWITTSQFCRLFNKFVTRNIKFLGRMITPNSMELGMQKPENMLLDEREIKQEMDIFLDDVKEESMEDDNSHSAIAPRLEEAMEPSVSHFPQAIHLIDPVQKCFIQKPTEFPKTYDESQYNNSFRFQNRRCSVCSHVYPRQNMKFVTTEEDKLVIMVGCVLLKQAHSLMSGKKTVFICHIHLLESINKIYETLNIKHSDEITSCSSELMDNLMVTVNGFYPQIESAQFCDIVHSFLRRNMSQKRKGKHNGKQQNYQCSVCTQKQFKNLKQVTLETEKLLILVGCVLRGDHSIQQAQLLMSRRNNVFICHIHFSEALNEIHKALNIKHPDEVFACSVELMNLMITVNKLDPHFEPWQLQIGLNEFYTRNKHLF